MTTRLFATGLLAGFLAGLLIAGLQHFTTTPLIIAAEVYENQGAQPHVHPSAAPAGTFGEARLILVHSEHDQAAEGQSEWAPADGIERTFYTSTVTVATAVGFALMLLAGMLAAGDRIDRWQGLMWAAAGFVVTGLAPSLGLPPELPGMSAADLVERQTWWIGTAAATAAALWLLLRSRSTALQAAGLVLLIVPHVFGAPHPGQVEAGAVPAELAARFAATSLAVHAALWAVTGFLAGWLWERNETAAAA
jgi:cobalt transporter subunit CbtA